MPDLSKNPHYFSRILLQWDHEHNNRRMPWKGEKDPYKIWLSEVILQQTRVEQGLNYYNNFIRTFPDVHKLAKAPAKKVFKLWEGLGYYSRCRNLIASAKYISKDLKGKFPDTYETIKELKGIGPYTAAAISSFAFNLPYAVLDGNVFRVLARIFGINTPIDSTEGKKKFVALANKLLDKKQPGLYNQAIMDFGAVICKPVPLCNQCPFKKTCFAFLNNKIKELPVKDKKIKIKKRWFYYLVIEYDNKTAIRQRIEKDIWQELFEFPMIEANKEQDLKIILADAEKNGLLKKKNYQVISVSPFYKQQLSHQLIAGRFITIKLKKNPGNGNKRIAIGWLWPAKNRLQKYPFPGIINEYRSQTKPLTLF
jgi:A/G-specific adenine glycosylase